VREFLLFTTWEKDIGIVLGANMIFHSQQREISDTLRIREGDEVER
jgi:hypothetical protein